MKITVAIHVEGHGGAPRTHSASQTLDDAADADTIRQAAIDLAGGQANAMLAQIRRGAVEPAPEPVESLDYDDTSDEETDEQP